LLAETKWLRNGPLLLILLAAFAPRARADVAVLLEEPYSYDGAFAGTGHTAVYLTRVCAETLVKLRRCLPGEHGVVISRYTRIAGYDWIAIPLVPYLYAVEDPDHIPFYADAKLVAFLRDQYRRAHLEELAPDDRSGDAPKGDWYELVGSAYDRTNYGFEISTTPDQDDALIEWLNSRPNRASYHFISHNCADFVREVLNFYHPKSESRANIADLFVGTPKHAAKSLVRYSNHHPELESRRFVIPQVPGAVRRSKPVRGVLESVFRAKKYVMPLALVHPIVAGGAMSVYLVGDRFNPARNADVFSLGGEPEAAPTKDERRAYLKGLQTVAAGRKGGNARDVERSWKNFVERAQPELDAGGYAVLAVPGDEGRIELSVDRVDLARGEAPLALEKEMMLARLKQSLVRSRAPRISSRELRENWQLLERIDTAERAQLLGGRDPASRVASGGSEQTSD
jgi:hypothetical protein